jgi:hypothetical protein
MTRRHALPVMLLALAFPAHAQEGSTPLFDGKTTAGWETVQSPEGNWFVQDGILVTKGDGGWLSTAKEYGNYSLGLDFKMSEGSNSGVFLRTPRKGDPAYVGMEIQLLDDDADKYKALKPFQYTGSVYGVIATKRGSLKPHDEWNSMEIRVDGPKIVIKLNGNVIIDGKLDEHPDEVKTHPGLLRKGGYIGLQSHGGRVEFKNITIKEL